MSKPPNGSLFRAPEHGTEAVRKPFADSHQVQFQTGLNDNNAVSERPVSPEEGAAFLKIARSTTLALARAGKIPAHPITAGKRKRWLFFLSELEAHIRGLGVNCDRHPCAIEEESNRFEAHT